jgi:putative transposase
MKKVWGGKSYEMMEVNMKVKRVERIWLKPSDDLSKMCHLSKNLFNESNYLVRQEFFSTGKWTRYTTLADQLKTSENYRQLPAQTAQQTLILVDKNWKSFFKAIKEWKKHPEKFLARPRIPGYKPKDGESIVIFTNQQASIKEGVLVLPKKAGFSEQMKTRIADLKEVRIIPKAIGYLLEIVYEKTINAPKRNKNRIAGIDIGVRNLVAVADNIGGMPIVVKGGVAKSMNQFYNKERARLSSIYDLQKIGAGNKAKRLVVKREKKMNDYLHKVSKAVVDLLVERNIGRLFIGHNESWKQKSNLGKMTNQNFVSIPFSTLIHMMQYKAEEQGIDVTVREESHTSVVSFFDNEPIEHQEIYAGKRNRGLFRTAKGRIVNADVNGALNIIRKAVPDAFAKVRADGIEGAVGHPLRLEAAL